ncbi:MAG: hypothetical protein ABIL29_06605, partial [candidate division WOR-3 bacterium]
RLEITRSWCRYRNSFLSNGGLAIDLDSTGFSGSAGDGVTCNDNLRQVGNPNELRYIPLCMG